MTDPAPELITLDTIGPEDDVVTEQFATYEESESEDPDAENASEDVQDVRP
jgi:hypothetical protein